MCQSHEEAWGTTNMAADLAMEKNHIQDYIHPGDQLIKLCNLLLK